MSVDYDESKIPMMSLAGLYTYAHVPLRQFIYEEFPDHIRRVAVIVPSCLHPLQRYGSFFVMTKMNLEGQWQVR